MKKILFLLVVAGSTITAPAQKIAATNVPQAVKDGLRKAHPAATATWEWEDANYEANFREGGREMSCVLNRQGAILETETAISLTELPEAAQNHLTKHYRGMKPKELARIVKADGETNYEVVFAGKELLFDAGGNLKAAEKEERGKINI